jgi:hypothetical protein
LTILSLLLALVPLSAAQPASPPQSDYALPAPPAVSTATLLEFTADHVDYDASSATMRLKGRVIVTQSTRTIKADELSMDTRDRTGRAQGFLLVEDGGSAVAAEDGGFFDFEQKTGELHKASAGHGFWRVHAKEARLSPHKKLDYLSADFTSCDVRPPHYHFHASRLTIVPKKYMLARNTSFWIGPVPLFYFPIFWKSLNPEHTVPIRFQPGYDRRNGPFVKGTMFRSIDRYTYDKIYLDYYGTQGPGFGNELQRRRGDDDRAALFGYYIREHPNGEQRWAVAGDVYRVIYSSLSMQGRLQIQSDPRFNNDYARSAVLRVTPELFNSGAFVWRQKKYWLRLAYNRHEEAAADQVHFNKTDEDYPRLDLQTTQLKVGPLPWLHTFTGFADNNFAQGRPFIQRSVGGSWEGTQVYPLGKGLSLVPKLGYSETWYDKFEEQATATSSATFQDVFVGHYKTQGDLRWKTPLGDWDLIHDYVRRLKPNEMADDAGASDHGVEQNLLTLRDLYHPARGLFLRVYSGYDFRVFRDRTLGLHDRLQPAVGEITYAPRPTLNWTLRDDYRIGEGNRSLLGSFLYGQEDLSFAQVSAGYNQGQPQRYEGDLNFALTNASATWRVGGILRNEVFTPGGAHRLALDRIHSFEKELSIAHAWHDFFTRALVRFRPGGVREFTAKVTLKFGPGGGSREAQPRRDWESEWFPERSAGVYDRP